MQTRPHIAVMLSVLVILLGWIGLNLVMPTRPMTDSGIFMGVATHMQAGRVLYRDVWDHKPPVILCLNWAALAVGSDPVPSVRLMERCFGAACALMVFGIAYAVTANRWIGLGSSLFFVGAFFAPNVFEGGNLAEEYGSFFLLGLIGFAVLAARGYYPRATRWLGGAMACLACLTKEPYVLCCGPWLLAMCFGPDRKLQTLLRNAAFTAAGVVSALLPFVLYFMLTGALMDWIHVIAYNFSYSAMDQTTKVDLILRTLNHSAGLVLGRSYLVFLLGLMAAVSVFSWKYQRETEGFVWIAGVSLLFCMVAAGMPNRHFGHYYLMLVPVWVLFCAAGAGFLLHSVRNCWKRPARQKFISQRHMRYVYSGGAGAIVILVAVMILTPAGGVAGRLVNHELDGLSVFRDMVAWPERYVPEYDLDDVLPIEILRTEGVWFQRGFGHYYAEAGVLSPTPYIYASSHLFIDTALESASERLSAFRDPLKTRPPALMLMSRFESSLPEDDPFIVEEYTQISRPELATVVLIRNDLLKSVRE